MKAFNLFMAALSCPLSKALMVLSSFEIKLFSVPSDRLMSSTSEIKSCVASAGVWAVTIAVSVSVAPSSSVTVKVAVYAPADV